MEKVAQPPLAGRPLLRSERDSRLAGEVTGKLVSYARTAASDEAERYV